MTHFNPEYSNRIQQDYGPQIAHDLNEWQSAELPGQPGERIEYVRLNARQGDADTKPVLLVNGYLAGIVANGAFGAEMASRGFDIIIPDQNRHGVLRNDVGKKDATLTQARAMEAILAAEDIGSTPMDAITHSYGSLVFAELTRLQVATSDAPFKHAKVAMLAPAGIKPEESGREFLLRTLAAARGKGYAEPHTFEDSYMPFAAEMLKPAVANVKANPLRAQKEGREIRNGHIDLPLVLRRGVGSIALVTFGDDVLFGGIELGPSIEDVIEARVTAFTPYSSEPFGTGVRGRTDAGHNDHQFNPRRVAASVEQFLRAA